MYSAFWRHALFVRGQSFSVKTFDRSCNCCQVIRLGPGNDFCGLSKQVLPLALAFLPLACLFFLVPTTSKRLLRRLDLCRSLQFTTCDICWFLLASVVRFKFLCTWFSTCIHWIISVMSRLWLRLLDPQLACLLSEQRSQFLHRWFSR